jgi:hypothetical protein
LPCSTAEKLALSSWINQVELWFALLTARALRGGVHRSTAELEPAIHDYIAVTNATPKPFQWTETADDILAAIQRFCLRTAPQPTLLRTSESGH